MYQAYIRCVVTLVSLLMMAACSDSNNSSNSPVAMPDSMPASTQSYQISISNLSYAQPLSPVAVIVHDNSYSGWTLGSPANDGLEQLAEGGDNSEFINAENALLTASGEGIIMPGATETIDVVVDEVPEVQLTLATMLVNTNDGFTGVTGLDIASLAVGDSRVIELPVFDAGTEANLELAGSIPGPADGGVGFDSMRDDVDYVARHPGVVSSEDRYAESVLSEAHRFDVPVAIMTLTRIE